MIVAEYAFDQVEAGRERGLLDLERTFVLDEPAQVRALVLRGIFLCRPSEIQWFLYGIRTVFPEAWRCCPGRFGTRAR